MREDAQRLSVGVAIVFYGIMLGIALGLAAWVWPQDVWFWHNRFETELWFDAAIGIAIGLSTVALSRVLERYFEWAKRLSAEFSKLLGPLTPGAVIVLAVTSSVAEELFFRGFLQQVLTERLFEGNLWAGLLLASLAFGLMHIGPNWKTFWPWTVMALVMGVVLGAAYLYTGNVLAPIIAHFTINFLNLSAIAESARE